MIQYDDLPEELRRLFGDTLIPLETRASINHGWDKMKPNERQELIGKLRKERGALERVMIAVMATTRVLLSCPSDDEITFGIEQ